PRLAPPWRRRCRGRAAQSRPRGSDWRAQPGQNPDVPLVAAVNEVRARSWCRLSRSEYWQRCAQGFRQLLSHDAVALYAPVAFRRAVVRDPVKPMLRTQITQQAAALEC